MLLVLTLSVLRAMTRRGASIAFSFDEAAVTNVCKAAGELDKIPAVALHKQSKAMNAIKAAQSAQLELLAAASRETDTNASSLYQAAALEAHKCAELQATHLEELVKPAFLATTNAAKSVGAINEFVDFLISASKGGGTGTCLANSGGGPTATNDQNRLQCPEAVTEDIVAADYKDSEALTSTGFDQLSNQAAKQTSGGASSKCHLLKTTGSSAVGQIWQRETPGAIPIMGGFIEVTQHSTASDTDIQIHKLNQIGEHWQARDNTKRPAKVFNKLKGLIEADDSNCGETAEDVIKYALDSTRAVSAVKAIRKSGNLYEKGRKGDYGTAKLLEEVSGKTTGQEEAILNKLKTIPLTKVLADKTEETTLKEVSGGDDLRASLLLQYIRRASRLAELEQELTTEKQKKLNTQPQKNN